MDKQASNNSSSTDKNPAVASVKKMRQRNTIIVIVIVVFIGWAVVSMFSHRDTKPKSTAHENSTHFVSPLNHVNEMDIWVEKIQNGLAKEQKTTESLQQQLQLLNAAKMTADKTNQDQAQQVATLQREVKQLESTIKNKSNPNVMNNQLGIPATDTAPSNGISEDHLQLTPQNISWNVSTIPAKNPDSYVPPGTFVRAVMIGGADTSAGVNSQSSPTPVLFRIIDQGTLPNQRRSHLKGCFATAAAIGDISSERGQMRLENLSCVAPSGEIVDMQVEGTVFGPEGKNGVRGVPLWREGALLKRAFVAGTLSGLSEGISQQYTTSQLTSTGTSTTINSGDVFRYGAAHGVSNAMEKIADYNIRRADQYHPVIQISAGTVVDIVFLKGFYLDGQKHNTKDAKKESTLPPFGMTTTQAVGARSDLAVPPPTTLPLTPQQIEVLKAQTVKHDSL